MRGHRLILSFNWIVPIVNGIWTGSVFLVDILNRLIEAVKIFESVYLIFQRLARPYRVVLVKHVPVVIWSDHALKLTTLGDLLLSFPIPCHFIGAYLLTTYYWLSSFFVTDTSLLPYMVIVLGLFYRESLLGLPVALLDVLVNGVSVLIEVELFEVNGVLTLDLLLDPLTGVSWLPPQRIRVFPVLLLQAEKIFPNGVVVFVKSRLQHWWLVRVFGEGCSILCCKIRPDVDICVMRFLSVAYLGGVFYILSTRDVRL